MQAQANTSSGKFAKYAWFALGYNILVILWGVFLRASYSGDGCGQHWLTCGGEVVPSAPQLKTLIEFSHRITTALDGFVVLVLLIWAFLAFPRKHIVRWMAISSFVMIIVEGLIGRGLVLTGNTAGAITPTRPYWTAGHLISTFILLGVLSLTAWYASERKRFTFAQVKSRDILLLGVGLAGILLSGVSGSVVALSNMLYPSASLIGGLAEDFSPASPGLVNLRIIHPILSIALSVFIYYYSLWIKRSAGEKDYTLKILANYTFALIFFQVGAGILTYFTHAPIVMQIVHLLLADLLWVVFLLMSVEFLAAQKIFHRRDIEFTEKN
jgi:cytochrome c oxidase assembly protein subunit 15